MKKVNAKAISRLQLISYKKTHKLVYNCEFNPYLYPGYKEEKKSLRRNVTQKLKKFIKNPNLSLNEIQTLQ